MEKPMDATSATAMSHVAVMSRTPEAKEGPGPDHDGDSDDKAVTAVTAPISSAKAPGVGTVVDIKA
jgi:hypothetical protein